MAPRCPELGAGGEQRQCPGSGPVAFHTDPATWEAWWTPVTSTFGLQMPANWPRSQRRWRWEVNLGPSSAGPGPLPRAWGSPRCPHPPAEHSASAPEPGGGLGHAPRMALLARSVHRSPNEAPAVCQPAWGVPTGSVGPVASGRRWGAQAPELLPPPSPAGWGREARPPPPGPTECSERGSRTAGDRGTARASGSDLKPKACSAPPRWLSPGDPLVCVSTGAQ